MIHQSHNRIRLMHAWHNISREAKIVRSVGTSNGVSGEMLSSLRDGKEHTHTRIVVGYIGSINRQRYGRKVMNNKVHTFK